MSNFRFDQWHHGCCKLCQVCVLLLLDLFHAWGAYYPHSLRYTVISCYVCSTQNIFSPDYDISRASVLEYCIKDEYWNIIRILCTMPCSMAQGFIHNPPKHTTCMLQLIQWKNQYQGWIDFIWNWLHSWKYHRLVFLMVYSPSHKVSISPYPQML